MLKGWLTSRIPQFPIISTKLDKPSEIREMFYGLPALQYHFLITRLGQYHC
jgi:hypothetical protein